MNIFDSQSGHDYLRTIIFYDDSYIYMLGTITNLLLIIDIVDEWTPRDDLSNRNNQRLKKQNSAFPMPLPNIPPFVKNIFG